MMTSPIVSYGQRWENMKPRPYNSSLFCQSIPSQVCSGDDIQAFIDEKICACRIIDILFNRSPPQLLVKMCLQESEVPDSASIQPLNPTVDQMIIGMIGVIHSNWLQWIVADAMVYFAYIFCAETLNTGMYPNVYGMKNSYFARYKLFSHNIQSHVVRLYIKESHSSFSHHISPLFLESSHHRIFQFLSKMKRNVDQVLWTEIKFKNANGIGQAQPMLLSPECWDYFIFRLKEDFIYRGHNFSEKNHAVQ